MATFGEWAGHQRPTLLELRGPVFMSYPSVRMCSTAGRKMAENIAHSFITRRSGLILDDHRKGFVSTDGPLSTTECGKTKGGRERGGAATPGVNSDPAIGEPMCPILHRQCIDYGGSLMVRGRFDRARRLLKIQSRTNQRRKHGAK